MDVAVWRRQLRTRLIEQRMQLGAKGHAAASETIGRLLDETLRRLGPKTVSSYWPFKAEVDLRDLMHRLRQDGWRTALPVVAGRGLPLVFRDWTAESEMEPGVHQIPIPRTGKAVLPDIVITPLVGFDERNYRLGYGAGYFDITLAAMKPPPLAIGIGFELGRLPPIHPAPTDIPMDVVITEAGIQEV
jgi:5-formyltetrahydrofolate cyclo-ligase